MTDLLPAKNAGESLCLTFEGDIKKALNYEMVRGLLGFDAFLSAVKQDALNNPKLAEAIRANPGSALNCFLLAAQMKLIPGAAYGLFYPIPRKRKGRLEIQPMVSYRGLCEVAQRHPRVHKIEAFCVYEGEKFRFLPGEGRIEHEYGLNVDRSDDKLIGAYARVVITDPSGQHPVLQDPVVWFMNREELLKRRACSDAWKYAESDGRKDSPWHLWFPDMCRKTVIRAVLQKGSVPRDMGVGMMIDAEDMTDLAEPPKGLPKPTVQASIREGLGIDGPGYRAEGVEAAIEDMEAATTLDDLRRIADGCQHFEGADAIAVAEAYDRNSLRLERDTEGDGDE